MAAITTAGSGNWSSTTPNAPWPSGTVPTSADTVTIDNGHTVTLNTTGCACNTLTVNSGGVLTCTTSANWDLTVGNSTGDTANIAFGNGATITLDMSASAAYTGTVYLNKGANTSGLGIRGSGTSSTTLKGANRKRLTRLNGAITAGATSAMVDDATGWAVGDLVVLGSTQAYNATPRVDVVTLTSVSGTSIGWTGGITYDHADDGYVGNFSSNLTIRPYGTNRAMCVLDGTGGLNVQNVAFNGLSDSATFGLSSFSINYGPTSGILNNNAFYTTHASNGSTVFLRFLSGPIQRQDNLIYCTVGSAIGGQASTVYCGDWERLAVFRSAINGLAFINPGEKFIDSIAMCCLSTLGGGVSGGAQGNELDGVSILACNNGVHNQSGTIATVTAIDTQVGTEFTAYNGNMFKFGGAGSYVAKDCLFQTSGTLLNGLVAASKPTFIGVDMVNKDNSVTTQEIYRPHLEIKRNNSTYNRSTSSISIKPTRTATDCQRELEILCADGATIRVVGYVQADANFYNSGTWTAPTVTLSGLGETDEVFTATSACNGAWEQFDLSITNNSGNDGNFTLTYTANANAVTTGTVYFDGVPDSPFVTKCRHYGFLIQESNPNRTVDPYTVAAEATAAAYTGVTINNTTKEISFAAGTADTAQKFYDYHQATICDNLDYDVAISRAGTLFSLLSTWTVIDPYYSGDVTWSGGTVQYSTYGTLADNLDGCIVEFADTGGGTYTLTGTLSGTLDLRNLDADPITVEVPTGTTTTDANNTGGAITVQEPQTYQSVVLTGGEAGSRVQLYDVTSSTELYNDVPGAWPFTWTDSAPYAANREIRLRVAYAAGADARQFIDQTIGTVTEADPELTYLVAQLDDSVYNANAIDGSALTGYAIVGTNLTIDVSDGTATWAEMYAYQVYWLSTEDGIRDQDLYIQAIDTANYVFYGGFQIRNTSSPSAPLLITGGNGEPSSGPATDLLDTTGGTIFVNSAIVVPYSSGAAVTEQIVRDGLTSQGYTTTRANAIDTIPEDVWSHNLP